MRIGIVGSGRIGGTLARLLVAAGDDVAIANSRGPESLAALVSELGRVRAETVEGAGHFGEVVVVAIPFFAALELPSDAFAGKVVVDANNYYAGRDGSIAALEDDTTTSSELLAAHLPGARIVKAFNTIHYGALGTEGRREAPLEQRLAIPVAGDDGEAKAQVAALVAELGFAPLDTGPLAEGGRLQQPGAPFFNRPLPLADAERELAAVRG